MDLKDYLSPDHVVLLKSATKADALAELANVAAEGRGMPDAGSLLEALNKREEMMSTGIGQGLAVPHVRMETVSRPLVAVGVSREGLPDYVSLDGRPVHVIVMILAPAGAHETYVRLLAAAADALKQADRREAIVTAERTRKVFDLMTGAPL